MKKISVIVMAIALVMALMVPFAASAATDGFKVTIPETTAKAGEEVTVDITYTSDDSVAVVLNGKLEVTFDADKLEAQIPASKVNKMSELDGAEVNAADAATGKIVVGFMASEGIETEGKVLSVTFKVKDGAEGDAEIKVTPVELVKQSDASAAGESMLGGEDNYEVTGKVVIGGEAEPSEPEATEPEATEPEATEPEATEPEATEPAGENQPGTKAPEKTGESTPWALIATVAVAGAALVVLSTKKSK